MTDDLNVVFAPDWRSGVPYQELLAKALERHNASELKALLTLPWVCHELDNDAFLDYAAWLSLPPPRTHFRQIRKLPAGCALRVQLDASMAQPTRYWQYDLSVEADLTDFDGALDEIDRALSESISLYLRADVPVGLLLSTGPDSRGQGNIADHGAHQSFGWPAVGDCLPMN